MIEQTIEKWHEVVKNDNPALLEEILADECTFWSPVVHTPQEGKLKSMMYLTGAKHVFDGANFHYLREVIQDDNAILEFAAEVDGIQINGVDMIRVNEQGKIIDFKVMIRPLKAVNMLHAKMKAMLEQLGTGIPTG